MIVNVSHNTSPQYIEKGFNVIKNYFSLFDSYLFNQAAESLKLKTNTALGFPWTIFWSPLSLLASCENIYYTLNYLEIRWIKKDHLDSMYTQTVSDFNKASRAFKDAQNLSTFEETRDQLKIFSQLISQAADLACLREQLIVIYRSLIDRGGSPNYEKYASQLEHLKDQLSKNGFTSKYFDNIRYNIATEISVLLNLMKTQIHLGNYDYKESIFHLYSAKMELDNWRSKFMELTASKDHEAIHPIKTGLFHWFHLFQRALHSKMTFYFYDILQIREKDMNTTCTQLDIHYHSVVENFVNKSSCYGVCLVLDATSMNNMCTPTGIPNDGYKCLLEEPEPLQGLKSWPCIFHYPKSFVPLFHWPNIVCLLMENGSELNGYGHPLYHYDSKINFTYFYIKLDPRILLVILFNKKKKKKDQVTQEFLYIVSTHLRNWRILSRLKPQEN